MGRFYTISDFKDMFDEFETGNMDEEDYYNGSVRRPYYIMRGKKITREQAFEIIRNEDRHYGVSDEVVCCNHFILPYIRDCYDWVSTWVDLDGNIGEDSITFKYPGYAELLKENINIANRYPFLEYVVAYTGYNEIPDRMWTEFDCCVPPFFSVDDIPESDFDYGVYVHDGGAEVVKYDRAVELLNNYISGYDSDIMFCRDDYNQYVRQLCTDEQIKVLSMNGYKSYSGVYKKSKSVEQCIQDEVSFIKEQLNSDIAERVRRVLEIVTSGRTDVKLRELNGILFNN